MYKFLFIIFLISLDITVKQIIFYTIDLNNFIYINVFFDLTHIHNFGISFGLFSNLLPAWIFVFIGLIITIFVLILFLQSKNMLEKWGYTVILAGAFGNILDRLINGFVIDFIYLHYKEFYWPAFNFADIYISIGFLMIILQMYYDVREKYFR